MKQWMRGTHKDGVTVQTMEVEMEREKKKCRWFLIWGETEVANLMEYGDWDVLMKRENVNDKSQVSGLHHSD